jgi:Na+-driven multidrug efflux pump
VLVSPSLIVKLFYDGAEHYQGLTSLFPALVVYTAAAIATELVGFYFQGIQQVRLITAINFVGLVTLLVLTKIFFATVGRLEGACLALAGAELVRLALTLTYLRRLLRGEARQPR